MLAVATVMGGCGHGSGRREATAQEAERFRALSLLTGARELKARGQPDMAAKLLLAIPRPEQLRDWEAVAHAVLAQPIPEVAWDVEGPGLSTAFSPDGTRGATGYPDGTVRVWRSDGKGEAVVLRGNEGSVESVTFSPDGARVLAIGSSGTARIWRSDGKGEPVVLQGFGASLQSGAFSPDGAWVVAAYPHETARVWRADGQGGPRVFQGHERRVNSAAFSRDGTRVVGLRRRDGTCVAHGQPGAGSHWPWRFERGAASHPKGGTESAVPPLDGAAAVTTPQSLPLRVARGRRGSLRLWCSHAPGNAGKRGDTYGCRPEAGSPEGQGVRRES
jgi:hypothetical protein